MFEGWWFSILSFFRRLKRREWKLPVEVFVSSGQLWLLEYGCHTQKIDQFYTSIMSPYTQVVHTTFYILLSILDAHYKLFLDLIPCTVSQSCFRFLQTHLSHLTNPSPSKPTILPLVAHTCFLKKNAHRLGSTSPNQDAQDASGFFSRFDRLRFPIHPKKMSCHPEVVTFFGILCGKNGQVQHITPKKTSWICSLLMDYQEKHLG